MLKHFSVVELNSENTEKKQHHEPSHDEDKKYVIVNQNKLLFLYFFFLSVVMLSNVSLNIWIHVLNLNVYTQWRVIRLGWSFSWKTCFGFYNDQIFFFFERIVAHKVNHHSENSNTIKTKSVSWSPFNIKTDIFFNVFDKMDKRRRRKKKTWCTKHQYWLG